jgi:hypothetical protein
MEPGVNETVEMLVSPSPIFRPILHESYRAVDQGVAEAQRSLLHQPDNSANDTLDL